jgi:hypothetical protein
MTVDISVSTDLDVLAADLTAMLQKDAINMGWPRQYASALTVSAEGTQIVVGYPEEYEEQINDLEYGAEDTTPIPVLRRFLDKNQEYVSNHLAEASLNYLFDFGILP